MISRPAFCLLFGCFWVSSNASAAPRRARAPHTVFEAHRAPQKTVSRPFRLLVPAMGLDILVVSGTDNAALRLAPGHDPLSALPGEAGNCIVASHRNVHGAYFWYLTQVKPGALITLQTRRESFTYRVASAQLVPDSRTEVLDSQIPPGAPPRLTLYTCTLPVSAHRFVVVANLVSRGTVSPAAFGRPAGVREITSGPLPLLKDKALHARYAALLRYAQEKGDAPKVLSEGGASTILAP